MKRITFLMVMLLSVLLSIHLSAGTKAQIPSYFVNTDFTGAAAYPTGTITNPGTWSAGTALYGGSASISWTSPASNQLNESASAGGGNRGLTHNFTSSGTEALVYVDFDWYITSWTIGQRNAFGLTLDDNGSTTGTPLTILCLYATGSDGKFHYANLDTDTIAFSTGGTFNRASAVSVANTNSMNYQTLIDFPIATGQWYNIKATLDFTNKKVNSLTITKKSDNSTITISTAYPFLTNASSITNVAKISLFNSRSNNTGTNGSTINFITSIDNFKVYKLIDVTTASVTINYKDSEGNLLKTSRVQPDLEIGTTYYATADDKATFYDDNFYYAYNAAASTDNVVVAEGAVINLIFKKTAKLSGTYIWSGNANSNWNNADENFSVGASPFIGYQDNNPILFPAVPVTKTVNLNANLTIGDNDITMFGDGYNFSGTGSISGSGKFILGMQAGETTTLGIRNNMSKVEIQGGEAILTNDLGTATYDLADGAKITLQTGAEFNKAITGTGSVTIQTNSNVFYNNTLTGPSTVNLILGVSGSISSGVNWSSKVLTAMPANAQVNVTTNQATAGYGVAANSVQNSKLYLGDNVRMLYNYNPNEGGTTIISIGELKGAASASIEGGWVNSATRGLNYYIGGLDTDATYNGVFKNYSTAPTAPLNISKKGVGIWTLTASNPDWILGSFKVDEGTVILNGSIPGAGVPVTVAQGATLKGTGTIGGATTVNGTLEGSLNFDGSLTLNGTTKFVVNGTNEGEYDAINVAGACNLGGTVDVTVNIASGVKGISKAKSVAPGTTIKLINAGNIVTTMPVTHFAASGWTFKPATGELVYDPNNVVSGINSNVVSFSIYPTLTRDVVYVEGNVKTIDIFSLTGQKVNSLVANGTKTVVNMSNLSSGAYIIRANMEDGSANMQNVILQK